MRPQHSCGDIEIQRLGGARTEELPELGEGRLLRLVGNKEKHLVSHGWPPPPFGGRASNPIRSAFQSRRDKGTVFHQSEAPIRNWRRMCSQRQARRAPAGTENVTMP